MFGLELRHILLTRVHTMARAAWLRSNPPLSLPALTPLRHGSPHGVPVGNKVAEGC